MVDTEMVRTVTVLLLFAENGGVEHTPTTPKRVQNCVPCVVVSAAMSRTVHPFCPFPPTKKVLTAAGSPHCVLKYCMMVTNWPPKGTDTVR